MKNKETLTPCILPWVSFGTNPFGKSRPCGYSAFKSKINVQDSTISKEFNNDLFKSIRKDFIAGKWPENCERCRYTEESHPGHSKKADSEYYNPQHFHLINQTRPDGSVQHFPKFIDIRLGTVCNLKCIHCGTGNSSKWLEDKPLLNKYPNTKVHHVDNSWIDRETPIWTDIYDHLFEIEKFNFIGGEPFASIQHNRFIEAVSKTEHAKNISLHYVTNGLLLTEKLWKIVQQFKDVAVNISLDASGDVLEFFRYPTNANDLDKKLKMFEASIAGPHVDLSLQWTSSNISIFYLPETLKYFEENFKNITFRFCNYVDYPAHMSPQNLPLEFKQEVINRLNPYLEKYPAINLYIRQMTDKNTWPQYGQTFIQYLDELSSCRKIRWKGKLKDFYNSLNKYVKESPQEPLGLHS